MRYPTKEEADDMRMKEDVTGMDLRKGARSPVQVIAKNMTSPKKTLKNYDDYS